MAAYPLIVIAGPTASGKTALAITLAKQFNGEIICADSRTVYKGMDIGTAKPTDEERAEVPHWGLDLVEPNEPYSAYEFKKYAQNKIRDIRSRDRVPFLVGGTGLYVDAVLFDYVFGSAADQGLRAELQGMTLEELYKYCIKHNIKLPENKENKRYVIRAIEQKNDVQSNKKQLLNNTIVVGIATEKEVLRERIRRRADQLFSDGVVDEATKLSKKYGWDSEAMTGNVYPLVRQYVSGNLSLNDMKEKFITLDWRLAKRQMTWLRRNHAVQWMTLGKAQRYIADRLANRSQ